MKVGIGLPSAVSPPDGRVVVEWAAAAEEAGFASVAAIDRLLAPTYDPLTVLAAAAAVTERVGLYTSARARSSTRPWSTGSRCSSGSTTPQARGWGRGARTSSTAARRSTT